MVNDNLRYNPTHTVSDALGQPVCDALPGYHAITGCDSVSSLFGIWKKKSFDALLASEQHHASLTELGNISIPVQLILSNLVSVICSLFTSSYIQHIAAPYYKSQLPGLCVDKIA